MKILTRNIAKSFIVDEPIPGVDLVTVGCEEQLQKRNRLKGLAMQKLVKEVMLKKKEDISIKKIFEEVTERGSEFYIVERPFRTYNNHYRKRWDYIHQEDFASYEEFWIREEIIDRTYKICNQCGQKIKAGEQFSKRCWKCKKGWFHFSNEKSIAWKLVERGSKERILDRLLKEQYIKPAPLKKRLDFFHYSQGIFEIYETKNKEDSGLTSMDLRKTLIYPFIVHKSGFLVEKFVLIFNGELTEELQREIRKGYGRNFPFKIELCSIGEYLNLNKLHIKAIQVKKENNEYIYQFIKGNDSRIIIDLTDV
ncbi:MAG: hypothetical protein ACFFDW_08680 [Candidatus Thorarchaeota archaeon]